MRVVNVAIAGLGGVGRQIAELLLARRGRYRERFSADVRITGVCVSAAGVIDPVGLELYQLARHSFTPGLTGLHFIDRVPADVLFEAGPSDYDTGGPGMIYLTAALRRGMDVVAVSKGALATNSGGLLTLARQHGASLRMSGAVGAGLPTLDLIEHSLAGSRVLRLEAVLTGTTTQILSKMAETGSGFEEALQEAQEAGIAEPDPSLDIDGWDTAAKLVIIANTALGAGLDLRSLRREGIRHVTSADAFHWRELQVSPRLIGFLDLTGSVADAGVELRLYPRDHPFALTRGSIKGIHLETKEMGHLTLLGGASNPIATAAAALKDFEHSLADLP